MITFDKYEYNFVSLDMLHMIILTYNWMNRTLFYLTDGCFLCCARVFEGWSAELFTAFIHTNNTIPCILFPFRCGRSLFFALNIIYTQSLFIYILASSCFVIYSKFHILYWFVDVYNCFVDEQFNKVCMYSNLPLALH